MAGNNEIRIRIHADDFASGVIRNVAEAARLLGQSFGAIISVNNQMAASLNSVVSSTQNLGSGLRTVTVEGNRMASNFQQSINNIVSTSQQANNQMASNAQNTANRISSASRQAANSVSSSSQQMAGSMQGVSSSFRAAATSAAGFLTAMVGFQGAAMAINQTFGSVISFSRSMETNQIGIAGILSSMTTLNGENLKWNQALSISSGLMNKLSNEAMRTNATTEELTTTFRALLGPGLGAGMKVDEIIKLTSVGATAVKSLGLNKMQLVQELRDLVQGGIQPASSTLANALTLKDSDIKAAKESAEGLFVFLMKRLEGFEAAGDASKKTMDGILDQIQEGIQRVGSEGTKPIFGAVKMELAEVANSLVSLNTETNEVVLNPQFINDLKYASEKAIEIGKNFMEVGEVIGTVVVPAAKMFGDGIVWVGENLKGVTALLAGLRGK